MRRIKFTNRETQRKHRRIGKVVLAWSIVIAAIALVIFVGVKIFLNMGYRSLRNKVISSGPVLEVPEELTENESSEAAPVPTEKPSVWKDSWVTYGDKVYEYNEDIMSFLVMGVDKQGKVKKNPTKVDGGQTDAIFLAIMNPDDKSIKLLGINRDTMVDIQMVGLGTQGEDKWTTAQLATQHGFGDGMEGSCELTRERVSELLFGLPIHGYVSINMGAVGPMTDAVGGVKLTCLQDMTRVKSKWKEGAEITLKGSDTLLYVQSRDCSEFESARDRLARQKQFLSVLGSTVKQKTKEDLTFPVKMYNQFKGYMVTDFSVDEISWLASELSDYEFNGDQIYTLEGETKQGDVFEEFYPDKAAMKDLMIRLFYREVDVDAYQN